MKLEDLTIGQKIQGPSGAVYIVKDFILPLFYGVVVMGKVPKAILVTEDARTINLATTAADVERYTGRIEVDQVALDRFVPAPTKEQP